MNTEGLPRDKHTWTREDWIVSDAKETKDFQPFILKSLNSIPGVVAIKVTKANVIGVSDILCCYRGKFLALELKVQKNKPTAHQLHFINEVTDASGVATVIRCWGDVEKILDFAK